MLPNAQIEKYVEDLLTVSGFTPDEGDGRLWSLLHHLYSAVAMYEHMTEEEKAVIKATQKKLRYFFETNCNLRKRKRTKNEREKVSPTPPLKEKEKEKEIELRTSVSAESGVLSLMAKRREKFRKECLAYVAKYDTGHLTDFFNYWSEESHHAGKMRFEAQRFWNLEKRLARWMQNQYSNEITGSAIRLEKTKAKQAAATTEADKQKRVAAERQQQDARREAEQERSKEGQMLTGEYLAKNPDSLLAKWAREREAREAKQKK